MARSGSLPLPSRAPLWLSAATGSVANRGTGYERPAASLDLGSQLAELLERTQLGPKLTFADHVHDLDPCNGRSGRCEAFEAQHGPDPTFDEAMVLSTKLFKYLIRTISIGTGQPKRFSIRLISLMPSVLAALLSMTIFRGRPLASIARAKNLIAAGLLRRFDNMKSKVFPNLSTAR